MDGIRVLSNIAWKKSILHSYTLLCHDLTKKKVNVLKESPCLARVVSCVEKCDDSGCVNKKWDWVIFVRG